VKGLMPDANTQGHVEYLVQRMKADAWADFWQGLGLVLYRFESFGLSASSTELRSGTSVSQSNVADMNEFRTDSSYVERVVEPFYDYLLRIDDVRGTGRLYLP
jgi:hypothetical protein